jgi:hypothetical protein
VRFSRVRMGSTLRLPVFLAKQVGAELTLDKPLVQEALQEKTQPRGGISAGVSPPCPKSQNWYLILGVTASAPPISCVNSRLFGQGWCLTTLMKRVAWQVAPQTSPPRRGAGMVAGVATALQGSRGAPRTIFGAVGRMS